MPPIYYHGNYNRYEGTDTDTITLFPRANS